MNSAQKATASSPRITVPRAEYEVFARKFSHSRPDSTHLTLYCQYQRLRDAGMTLSRTTLTYYVDRTIELLRPINDAHLQPVLRSRMSATDEAPHKAGPKCKGKLNSVWY